MTDILEDLPESEISRILEIVSRDLPTSLSIHEFLKASLFWQKTDSTFDSRFYWYPENVESGVFVGILHSGCQKPGIFVYAARGCEALLHRVLLTTEKIDWKLLPLFHSVIPRLTETVENVIKKKRFSPELCFDGWVLSADANTVSNYEPELSSKVYSAKLRPEHVDSVYDCWPAKDMYTKDAIRYAVTHRICVGIFSKDADELLAWCILSPYGAVGALQTQPHARGSGYGRTAVMLLARQLVRLSFVPFTVTVAHNRPALATFESIRFQRVAKVRYIRVSPQLECRSKL